MYFGNSHISDDIEAVAFKLGMALDLFMAYSAHAHFEDLDFDARSQWDGYGKNKSALNFVDN